MRRMITLIAAIFMTLVLALPAAAHPVNPPTQLPDHAKADMFAGDGSGAHSKGLACAAEKSMAITPLAQFDCTIGFGRDS